MTQIRKVVFAAMAILIFAAPVSAQSGGSRIRPPLRRPTTSPYLNLLRNPATGGGFGFNYYQRVRPEFDYLETSQRLSRSLTQVQRRQTALQRELTTGRGETGHATSFLNYGGYYQLPGR